MTSLHESASVGLLDTVKGVKSQKKTSIWSARQFGTRLSSGHAIGASLQKIRKSHSIPISTKIRLIKALAWPVAMYGCESGTLRKK